MRSRMGWRIFLHLSPGDVYFSRDWTVHGELILSELADKFRTFIEEKYHREAHSETKQSPVEFWAQHCLPRQATPRDAAYLLPVVAHHAVSKGIFQYRGRRYWHDDLWKVPGDATIEIRAQPKYMRPDDVQVLYEGKWICPAFALDSEAGRKVDGKRVLTAQRRQRRAIQQTINEKRAILQSVDQPSSEDPLAQHEQKRQPQQPHHPQQSSSARTRASQQNVSPPTLFSTTAKQTASAWGAAVAATEQREQRERGKR
jgi:hypothetical protein